MAETDTAKGPARGPGESDKLANADRVCIGCNLPNGFFMNAWKESEGNVPLLGGGYYKEKRYVADPDRERVKINGAAFPLGEPPEHRIVHGYALTPNVPGDIAREWFRMMKDSPLVKNQCVVIGTSSNEVSMRAADLKANRSGLEPINTATRHVQGREIPVDPRWPKPLNPNLSGVQTHTEKEPV